MGRSQPPAYRAPELFLASPQEPRLCDDFFSQVFASVGHQVDTGDAFDFLDLLDHFDADVLSLSLWIGSAFDSLDEPVRDVNARYV